MLNQHQNLAVPLSDFLRIGDCVLDLPRREISAPQRAQPMRVTVKAQQVLLALVAQHGRVVSREALIEWVWPDTLPTDDVLTQAIAQLRKAFCDDRDAPRYLETIAKGGYRLLAPLRWVESGEADAVEVAAPGVPGVVRSEPAGTASAEAAAPLAATPVAVPPSPSPSPRMPRWLDAAVVAAVALGAVALLLRDPRPTPAAKAPPVAAAPAAAPAAPAGPLDYQRITSLPGDESWPSVSPDGGQVAYSAYSKEGDSAALMVQATAPVAARELTPLVKGRSDVMAAWSPDGRQIAFMRYEDGESRCALLLSPSSGGGATRTLGRCFPGMMPSYSWHPDARHIIALGIGDTEQEAATFRVLDLDTGAWTRLPYEKGDTDFDMSPTYSPDGRWIAFQRNISLSDLWRMPAEGGKPERLTHLRVNVYGLAWTPDSRSIVFAAYRDDGTTLMRLDLGDRKVTRLGGAEADVAYPSIAVGAGSMAFMLSTSHGGIYALPMDGGAAAPAPERIFPSTGKDLLPAVSPDGGQIAFVSNRTGRPALWLAELDRPESLRLVEGLVPIARFAPVWSSDSRRMLVAGRRPGSEEGGVFEVEPASGQLRQLPIPAPSPIRAEYLPDPSRLLAIADLGGGRLGLMLYDRSVSPWRVVGSIDDVVFAKVDAARKRVLFTRPSRSGLWQAGLDLSGAKMIAERPGSGAPASRRLVIGQDGVWLAAADTDCGLRWMALEDDSRPARCLHKEFLGVTSFSYDNRRKRLYYSSEVADNSDIGWMQLPASGLQ